MRRFSLTGTFAVVSLSTMALLALALVWLFNATLQEQARNDAERVAQVLVSLGVEQKLNSGKLKVWLGQEELGPTDADALAIYTGNRSKRDVTSIDLYTKDGELFYSSEWQGQQLDSRDVPEGRSDPAMVQEALGGQTVSALETGPDGKKLAIYVPVTFGDAYSGTFGVAEIGVPYESTETLVRQAVVSVALVILVILLLAWLALYRTVHGASHRLRQQAEENERLALHDPLTGLPNRRLLGDRLDRAIASSARSGQHIALMILDVDRFKEVNDTLGHDRGDALLSEVAERLASVVRDADTVARLGGDEFAVLAPTVASVADAERLARRLHSVFDRPFLIDELVLHVESSIGVAVLPDHATDSTELMQRADVAMYGAKSAHLGVLVYDPVTDGSSTDRLLMLGDLRNALGTRQLTMHYQPKIDLTTGEPVGLEALLRWTHPERGSVPPVEFIPLAERTGLIHSITRYVLEMVVVQMSEWDRVNAQFAHLPVAVNLSARNLVEPSLADFVEDLLASHMVDPSRIELEVTESALIEDPVRTHEMMHRLAALGVTLAVDDFGTGYTSMSQLEQMPLTTLKIDRSFIVRMVEDPNGATLVKAMVELAHEFGLEVVAEGVEDQEAKERLQDLGCDVGQGYHWSRPVPGEDLPEVLFQLSFRRASSGASVRS